MSIGVATANSILLSTFANDQRKRGLSSRDAALAAGMTRLRPVVMTALAMIIGMLPRSLTIEGDYGADLGVAEGIEADSRVISNPSERLSEGLEVEVASPAPPPGSAAPRAAAAAEKK